jgi:hypothetical protein
MLPDLIAHILAGPAVASTIGARLRPVQRDQSDALPAALINEISRIDDQTMAGPSGYIATRVQIDVFAANASDAIAAAGAIRTRLNGFKGIVGQTRFLGVFPDGQGTSFEDGPTATTRLVRIRLDFQIHHRGA